MEPEISRYHAIRRARKRARCGQHARCEDCGDTNIVHLQATNAGAVLCAECAHIAHGRSPYERHHPSGQHNDCAPTVRLLANDHQELTDMQHDWPSATLENPTRDPGFRVAAVGRAVGDFLIFLGTRVNEVVDGIETRVRELRERFGGGWPALLWQAVLSTMTAVERGQLSIEEGIHA